MKTIGQVLRNNFGTVVKVAPTATVREALEVMARHDVGAVLVMEDGRLLGIVTERDYARKVSLRGRSSETTCVLDVMTSKVFCATPYMTVEEAMALASDHHVRHLPVLDMHRGVVGVISTRDLVREKLAEQNFVIRQLEQYIAA
ncbi:MAG TPA: CBS domain-containing protein [Rhodocyclaceae bacterium]